MSLNGKVAGIAVVLFLVVSGDPYIHATEEYAGLTGQECSVCHLTGSGGGGLTPAGEGYMADADNWMPPETGKGKIPLELRVTHLLILYLHIFFSIVWIGTILYVHLVLKPRYVLGGLPRSELRLAWLSMPIIAGTGLLLTAYRLKVTPALFQTVFGRLLIGKIGLFSLMVCSATFVTLFVGPRLRRIAESRSSSKGTEEKTGFTMEDLRGFIGEGASRALVAVDGLVWDVTGSRHWENGLHAGRHRAGQDLTEYMKQAPHGVKVLENVKKVGVLATAEQKQPAIVKVFKVNAYFNLAGCFLIILILALWRW